MKRFLAALQIPAPTATTATFGASALDSSVAPRGDPEARLLVRFGSDLLPAAGAAFHIRIVAFRIAAIMPIVGCLGLGLHLHDILALYVNRRRRRYGNHRGIGDRRVTVSPVPISVSGRIKPGAAAVIAQTESAQ
jgi:hypothetical protein